MRMVMAPVRWVSLLLALSLVVAALPGFSETLPGVDGLEGTADEADEPVQGTLEDPTGTTDGTVEGTSEATTDTVDGTEGTNGTLPETTGPSPLLDDTTGDEAGAARSATCVPHDSGDGRLVCTVLEACLDHLYRTPACSPPPQCIDRGNATFECYPRDRLEELVEPGPHAAPWAGTADCLPSPEAWDTLVCELPPRCHGDLGVTEACRPAPACTLDDGRFTCRVADLGAGGSGPMVPAPHELLTREALAHEIQAVIHATIGPFRASIDQLRATYQAGLDEIQASYDAKKAHAHDAYLACREKTAGDPAGQSRCLETAHEQLSTLRAEAHRSEAELRERLVDQAESLRDGTCQHLADRIETLVARSATGLGLEGLVDVQALSLCQDAL